MMPNNNQMVLSMLAHELRRRNKGRNRILLGTVALGIVTLTAIFGVSLGKIKAEYTKSIRSAGTTASAVLEDATEDQYQQIQSLSYVKAAGRMITAGSLSKVNENSEDTENAESDGKRIGRVSMLDSNAWKKIISPAYTGIHGHYPKKKQDIMLSVKMLKALDISSPKEGMEIKLNVLVGWKQAQDETFYLSGWYTSYRNSGFDVEQGYVSEQKIREWGFKPEESAEILIRTSDQMHREEVEEKLYEDVQRTDSDQKFTVKNTAAFSAVNQLTGSYEMAVLGVVVILSGIYFLIYNIMQISMTGDIRQMGLLYTIGTTRKQLWKIYHRQLSYSLILGSIMGILFSMLLLFFGVPKLLGRQYLSAYGGAEEFSVFQPGVLLAAVVFTLLIIEIAAQRNISRTVKNSCVESMHYAGHDAGSSKIYKWTGERDNRRSQNRMPGGKWSQGIEKYKKNVRTKDFARKCKLRKRSSFSEMAVLGWKNVTRQKSRFFLTVLSLFLGVEALLGTVVITGGSDVTNIYKQKPDFMIVEDFSQEAKDTEAFTYEPDEESLDSFVTDANTMDLLLGDDDYTKDYDPVPETVRKQILSLDGIEQKRVKTVEGAYLFPVISEKGWKPLGEYFRIAVDDSEENSSKESDEGADTLPGNVDSNEESSVMMRAGFPETVRVLMEEELEALKEYVQKEKLQVDLTSVENGNGILILQEHGMTPEQEEVAEKAVGESMYFLNLPSEEEAKKIQENSVNDEAVEISEQKSENFTLCGYLDGRKEDFPEIKSGWHGENMLFFLVSEKGFERLGVGKKTLYMEVDAKKEKEPEVKQEIKEILTEANVERTENGGAGIRLLCKSDLLEKMSGKIRGNRMILGSIGALLLLAGMVNYFNVVVMGIYSRRRELKVMEQIGMTKKQRKQMLLMEGMYYFLLLEGFVLSAGTGILLLVRRYMESQVEYFVFRYPFGWLMIITLGLAGICVITDLVYAKQKSDSNLIFSPLNAKIRIGDFRKGD